MHNAGMGIRHLVACDTNATRLRGFFPKLKQIATEVLSYLRCYYLLNLYGTIGSIPTQPIWY